ncbi:hypothetical protein BDF21DRAFT_54738 [Thamnidium elegans]|nr:hypothetical protein BDF21DRAFT_54738 [Thamnidium elegans]
MVIFIVCIRLKWLSTILSQLVPVFSIISVTCMEKHLRYKCFFLISMYIKITIKTSFAIFIYFNYISSKTINTQIKNKIKITFYFLYLLTFKT